MLVIRVIGTREPYLFIGSGTSDWITQGDTLCVTRMLPNPKKVATDDGKTITVDREAVAVFSLRTLEAVLLQPDPHQQSERPLIEVPGVVPPATPFRRGPN